MCRQISDNRWLREKPTGCNKLGDKAFCASVAQAAVIRWLRKSSLTPSHTISPCVFNKIQHRVIFNLELGTQVVRGAPDLVRLRIPM